MIVRYKRMFKIPHTETVGTETVDLSPFACAVEVSLTRTDLSECPPEAPRFLAVADTAFSGTFLIRQALLQRWVGWTVSPPWVQLPIGFPQGMTVRDRNQIVLRQQSLVRLVDIGGIARILPAYMADLWLHPYQSRTYRMPFRISLPDGLVLFPTPTNNSAEGPPLPILGAAALHAAGLKLIANYAKLDFCIQPG